MNWKKCLGWIGGALALLLVGQVLSQAVSGYGKTAVATVYREPKVYITGTVLRQEEPVTLPDSEAWAPAVASGKRVGAGQTLFYADKSPDAADAARQVRMLRQSISLQSTPLVTRRNTLRDAIRAINSGDSETRQLQSERLGALCRSEQPEMALEQALASAEQRLKDLSEPGAAPLTAPASGIFSMTWDANQRDLSTAAQAVGRLVTGDTWYYSAVLPRVVEAGETIHLELLSGIFSTGSFRVEEVSKTSEGYECLLSCRTHLAEVSELQTLTAAYPQKESGLEIPARAVYTVNNETGVWCLVGDSPRWKPVTVLESMDDTVVVALDRSSTENLWPGDTVLLDFQE